METQSQLYETPEMEEVTLSTSFAILAGSSLENPKPGEEWGW